MLSDFQFLLKDRCAIATAMFVKCIFAKGLREQRISLIMVFLLARRTIEDVLSSFVEANMMLTKTPAITTILYFIPVVLAKCPIGTTQGPTNTQCFLFRTAPSEWFTAEQDCVSRNGHLASVHDNLTNKFLTSLGGGCANELWIGGESFVQETWSWTDGTRWQYTNWPSGRYPSQKHGKMNAVVRGNIAPKMGVNRDRH